ncbi:MAG: tetratricopeptide repeat protein [Betaproteobacteria bacterium]|nr:tetratricopeptide repeat protein [Betaproteobacteria bacterium]
MPLFRLALLALAAALPLSAAWADGVDDARAMLRQGQPAAALARVDAYLKDNPKDARGRFLRGVILTEQQKPDEAIAVFRALNEDMPELPEPYNNLAVLYAAKGRYDDARRVLETAVLAHPGYALAHENLGDVYAQLAARAYAQAAKLDPKATSTREKLKLAEQLLAR